MKCPFCSHTDSKVVDSRETKEGDAIRRRRECERCGRRFTSYERIDPIQYMVVKKDGRREPFDRGRVIAGMLKACQKRPVSGRQLEEVADQLEGMLHGRSEKEVSTADVGAFVMERLRTLDQVAYVRFASVYREFRDVDEFVKVMDDLKDLLGPRE